MKMSSNIKMTFHFIQNYATIFFKYSKGVSNIFKRKPFFFVKNYAKKTKYSAIEWKGYFFLSCKLITNVDELPRTKPYTFL